MSCPQGLSRRHFLAVSAAAAITPPTHQTPARTPLRVQPLLTYEIVSSRRRGGIETVQELAAEKERIGKELAAIQAQAGFAVEFAPLEAIQTAEEVARIPMRPRDATLLYASGAGVKVQQLLATPDSWNLMFLRRRSGPAYLWYEIAHPRFLRNKVDVYGQTGMTVQDVIIDDQHELMWRLRALHGLKTTLGKRVVVAGGVTRQLWAPAWKMECRFVGDGEVRQRMQQTGQLSDVFRDLLKEARTDAITIAARYGATACRRLNAEGYLAFCGTSFAAVPSAILGRHLTDPREARFALRKIGLDGDGLVAEVAHAREHHGELQPIRRGDHFIVAD